NAAVHERELDPTGVATAEVDEMARVRGNVRDHEIEGQAGRATEQVVPILGMGRAEGEGPPAAVTVGARVGVIAVALADGGRVAQTIDDAGDAKAAVLVERPVEP